MLDLRTATPKAWLDAVFGDFDAFIVDHAACERKASATGMSFVVRYPDRPELIEPMIEFAREELEHFHIMYKLCAERGLSLAADYKDDYVNGLRSRVRTSRDEHLLDRLLVAGIVEARGCERLFLVAEALREQSSPSPTLTWILPVRSLAITASSFAWRASSSATSSPMREARSSSTTRPSSSLACRTARQCTELAFRTFG